MSRLYQWNFASQDWEGYLSFTSNQTTQVIHNLFVNSNIITGNLEANTIDNEQLFMTSNVTFINQSNIVRLDSNVKTVDSNVVSLSNYVYGLNQNEITDIFTLRTSEENKYNQTTLQCINNNLISGITITHGNSNPKLADFGDNSNWGFYGAKPKIRYNNDIWCGSNNVYTNRVVCTSMYYDSWINGMVDNYAQNIFSLSQGDDLYAVPPYLGTRRVIIDTDGYVPVSAIKGLPNFSKIADSVTGAVVGSSVGSILLAFGLGALGGYVWKSSQIPREIPRPPGYNQVPTLDDSSSLGSGANQGTTGVQPENPEIEPFNPEFPNGPENEPPTRRGTNVETNTIPDYVDPRNRFPRQLEGSSTRFRDQDSSRCCGCLRRNRSSYTRVPTRDVFRNNRGGPPLLNNNPLFDYESAFHPIGPPI